MSGGHSNGTEESDFLGAFGMEGDDANEFLEPFSTHLEVDLSEIRWEFHYNADEPPNYRRIWPLDANGHLIPYVPITIYQLVAAVNTGAWQYVYPKHTIQKKPSLIWLWAFVIGVLLLGAFSS